MIRCVDSTTNCGTVGQTRGPTSHQERLLDQNLPHKIWLARITQNEWYSSVNKTSLPHIVITHPLLSQQTVFQSTNKYSSNLNDAKVSISTEWYLDEAAFSRGIDSLLYHNGKWTPQMQVWLTNMRCGTVNNGFKKQPSRSWLRLGGCQLPIQVTLTPQVTNLANSYDI